MKLLKLLIVIMVLSTSISGCKQIDFEPYDYKKNKKAKLKFPSFGCSLKIRRKKVVLRKKIKFPTPNYCSEIINGGDNFVDYYLLDSNKGEQ